MQCGGHCSVVRRLADSRTVQSAPQSPIRADLEAPRRRERFTAVDHCPRPDRQHRDRLEEFFVRIAETEVGEGGYDQRVAGIEPDFSAAYGCGSATRDGDQNFLAGQLMNFAGTPGSSVTRQTAVSCDPRLGAARPVKVTPVAPGILKIGAAGDGMWGTYLSCDRMTCRTGEAIGI